MKKIEDIFKDIDPIKVPKINYQEALGIVYSKYKNQDEKIYLDSKDSGLKPYHALTIYDRLKLSTFIKDQNDLLELYKKFFDKLNIQLRNTFDIDYIYPHEFIIGYDIKSEDKELVKLFKQIKELENERKKN